MKEEKLANALAYSQKALHELAESDVRMIEDKGWIQIANAYINLQNVTTQLTEVLKGGDQSEKSNCRVY